MPPQLVFSVLFFTVKWRFFFNFRKRWCCNFGAFMCNLGTTLCSRFIKGDVTLRFLGLLCEAFEALCAQGYDETSNNWEDYLRYVNPEGV
ncbi:hypothetical protein D8674_003206 [Pyrus ussuriensis x Pyrus communis]|uniref:Uncharacterized protein n=1 Tax=Pyrus ussuriensis x Pyrus communis TaxID=2448454 RepID=A0A5N5FKI3_9ROSA|nr:hypothetical protein D8674_003206 [Pyrus ussuriensis x Pyrus communis]